MRGGGGGGCCLVDVALIWSERKYVELGNSCRGTVKARGSQLDIISCARRE